MGIEIYLSIFPDRIAPEAWAAVYQETLKVLDNFAFMDVVKGKYGMYFATKARHRDNLFDGYRGWHSAGDLVTGWNTEDFYLVENINYYRDRQHNDNGKDILLIHAQDDKELDPPSAAFVFGAKTQGMFSHIPLLAVACLVTHRFPDAALVHGDITDGQCERAVDWINTFLDDPIDIPYTADMTRLVPRLLNAGLPNNRILELVFRTTLQAKDAWLGAYLKEHLSTEQINSYFFEQLLFQRHGREIWLLSIPMLRQYLEMGFDFRELCSMVLGDHERKQDPELFLNDLLHMKLHIEIDKKNLFDVSASPDETGDRKKVATVSDQLFRAFAMMHGAGNKNVNAYIPLEQIKADMHSVLGDDGFDEMFDRVVSEYTGAAEGSAQAVLYDTPESKY